MNSIKKKIKSAFRRLNYRTVDFDTDIFMPYLDKINQYKFSVLTDQELRNISAELKTRAANGVQLFELLPEAFALVREAAWRILKMRPFDVQVIAGMAMFDGRMVQMQTGEGKTLTAVFPAYLHALSGKGVHVLTFNDYLAERDAEWMGAVYRFLGLSVGYIKEGMSHIERRLSYNDDITYLTAKEAGFDYLRGFICSHKAGLLQRPFNFAIIDEADSILIDEARIPLVIAGETAENGPEPRVFTEIVRGLKPAEDYETDEYKRNVFLTEKGFNLVEKALGVKLYDERKIHYIVGINNALHAEVLLKRDIDYIVRNGRVELVDEFTGRVAEKRHWPHGLQEAVEAKENIRSASKGKILASVTLQNFIGLYPQICGMTGTALSAADEFAEFYRMKVTVIPTNRPCIRMDYPDVILTHKEAKHIAVLREIIRVHASGRPILIGTGSVEESELLAEKLSVVNIECNVLNAKNDEMEAGIIADAGAFGRVTVSTNMAGRGTDIKLGGKDEKDRDRVVALGGLYVIGTNRHESRRVDDQLRGRAGRQGDPGSSRFFISLEDDLMLRYRLKDLIPKAVYPKKQMAPIVHSVIKREIRNAQRIVEGQNFDIRRTLSKYSVIIERQRRSIYSWKMDLLSETTYMSLMPSHLPDRFSELSRKLGVAPLIKAERQVALYFISKCWADYLDYMSYVQDSIYLVNIGGKVPIDEYNKTAVVGFEKLKEEITTEVVQILAKAEITADGIDLEKEGLRAPTSTWTYIVDDRPDQLGINPITSNPIAAMVSLPLWAGAAIFFRFSKKSKALE